MLGHIEICAFGRRRHNPDHAIRGRRVQAANILRQASQYGGTAAVSDGLRVVRVSGENVRNPVERQKPMSRHPRTLSARIARVQ